MPSMPPSFRLRVLNRYKANRLWNINANIVFADLASTAATALIVEVLQARLSNPMILMSATAVIDGAISLAVFATLHLYANRARGVKDLLQVQVHRWLLSPLHFVIGAGLQYSLLLAGARTGVGVLVAYLSAIAIVRAIHTLYGKRAGLFH